MQETNDASVLENIMNVILTIILYYISKEDLLYARGGGIT